MIPCIRAVALLVGVFAAAPPEPEWPALKHTLRGYSGGLAFSPDGKLLATAAANGGTIKLWNLERGK